MKPFHLIAAGLFGLLLGYGIPSRCEEASNDTRTAWNELQRAAILPAKPASWNRQPPTPKERQQFFQQVANAAAAVAEKAETFYTKFPNSTNVLAAKKLECNILKAAFFQGGRNQNAFDMWKTALNALLQEPKLPDNDRFDTLMDIALSKGNDPQLDSTTCESQYEQALQQIIKEYPKRDQPYADLLGVRAEFENNERARSIADEVVSAPVSDSVKVKAKAILRRLNALGKPLDIKFTAVDGREVDLAQMKGKVVLVEFWATWCGPCVHEIPNVKEAYDKFHSKGFEIVGISFDSDKARLQNFVQTHGLPWPQFFDGQSWRNQIGSQYAVGAIPTIWLVDKKGVLRDPDADPYPPVLQGKLEQLLAE